MSILDRIVCSAATVVLLATVVGCVSSARNADVAPAHSVENIRPTTDSCPEWFIQPDWNARLSGRFEFEDGRAAAGVGYSLVWIDSPPDSASWWNPRTTDARGRFSVGRLPRGAFEIDVYPASEPGEPDIAAAIVGPFQSGDDDVVVNVRPGRKLVGRVTMSDGDGVAGAAIEIGPRLSSGPVIVRVKSSDDGSFAALHAPHGPIYVRVDARDVGEGGRERLVVDLGPIDPKDAPLQVEMDRGLAIAGRLTDADGKPRSDVSLVAVPHGEAAPLRDDATWNGCRTDGDGRFAIRGLAPGVYQVWACPWDESRRFTMGVYKSGECSSVPLDGDAGTRAGASGVTLTWNE